MSRIFFTTGAERDYKKLSVEIQARVTNVLEGRFASDPFAPEFKTTKLKPPLHGYKVRVGNYRILFEFSPDLITVHKIKHRKDAYR
jgi:mRNA-degrading endonuclease RelE of RelBE toxin-antitoxin system